MSVEVSAEVKALKGEMSAEIWNSWNTEAVNAVVEVAAEIQILKAVEIEVETEVVKKVFV